MPRAQKTDAARRTPDSTTPWEPAWEEDPGTSALRARRRWLPSTRLLILALGFWVGAMAVMALGLYGGSSGSNQAMLALFLVCLVVSSIAAAFSSFLAVFGLFKYRRRKVWNLLLLLVSLATNPVLLILLAAANMA